MKNYKIKLSGCDAETEFQISLTEDEYVLLKKVGELSKEHSEYHCQPQMSIELELHIDGELL